VGVSGRGEFEYLLCGLGSMDSLLEERVHRVLGDIAPADQPLVSLKAGAVSSVGFVIGLLSASGPAAGC
jgi:hypothetical protein